MDRKVSEKVGVREGWSLVRGNYGDNGFTKGAI